MEDKKIMASGGEPLKVGIVGCGQVAKHHLKFLDERKDVEIVGLADKDTDRAVQLGGQYGIASRFASLEELLEAKRPDVLHILTPPQCHFEQARKAIERGAHVLVEKPMAFCHKEVEGLFTLAEKKGVRICPDFIHLFNPAILEAKATIRHGGFGRLLHVECYMAVGLSAPEITEPIELHWKYILPGGLIQDYLCHPLYLILDWVGGPTKVTAFPRQFGRLPQRLTDHVDILLQGEAANGKISITFAQEKETYYLKLFFDKGTVTVDFICQTVLVEKAGGLPRSVNRVAMNFGKGRQLVSQSVRNVLRFLRRELVPYQGLRGLMQAFYGWIDGRNDCPIPRKLALDVSKAEEEILKQVGKVHLDLSPKASCQKGIRKKERILLTGGTGYLGTEIARRLAAAGYYLRAYVRKTSYTEALEDLGIELVYGDIRQYQLLEEAAQRMDLVVHAAAGLKGSDPFVLGTCVKGTMNVAEAARRARVAKVIYLSSFSVFEFLHIKDGAFLTEESPLESQPEKRGSASRAKRLAEKIALANLSENRPAWTILRPALIFGNGRDLRSLIGPRIGNVLLSFGRRGKHLSLIHAKDVAKAVLASIENETAEHTVFNITHHDWMTVGNLVEECFKRNNSKKPHVVYVPYSLAFLAMATLRLFFLALGRRSRMSEVRLAYACRDVLAVSDAFSNATGWQPEEPLLLQLKKEAKTV